MKSYAIVGIAPNYHNVSLHKICFFQVLNVSFSNFCGINRTVDLNSTANAKKIRIIWIHIKEILVIIINLWLMRTGGCFGLVGGEISSRLDISYLTGDSSEMRRLFTYNI